MTKKNIRYAGEAEASLGKLLRSFGSRHRLWEVFKDFVALTALAISNKVDHCNYEAREAEYLRIVGRYEREEVYRLATGYELILDGLSTPCDFLGALFMKLELGDSWRGQFFTPYPVCQLMASLTFDSIGVQRCIKDAGYVSVSDPAVGGGATLIAFAEAVRNAGFNYQQQMHAVAVDVDITAVHMAYIQLSLLGIPAVVYHGNSLTMKMESAWITPLHRIGFWDRKLQKTAPAPPLDLTPAKTDFVWPAAKPRTRNAA